VPFALGPLHLVSHLRVPLPGEVIIQRGQRDVGQQRGQHAPSAMDNFCFDVTLSYRRLERPRRVPAEL
jgi:hypothetical protein